MPDRFVDYFELAGLDPDGTREDNYELIKEAHRVAGGKMGSRGRTDAALLTEAMEIFRDPARYQEYRVVWERRRHRDEEPEPAGPQPEPAGVWGVLGTVAAKGLEAYLAQRRSQGGDQEERRVGGARSLSGRWLDGAGNIIQVHQIGNQLRLRATDGYGAMVFDGEGRLAGRRIEFVGRNLTGQTARGTLLVAPDGDLIEGRITWFQLNLPVNVSPVRLMRS